MTARTLRFALAAALVVTSGAGMAPSQAQTASAEVFDSAAFFTGATVGKGTLKELFSAPRATSVTTFGTMRADGVLVLDQQVKIGDDPVKHRVWKLREPAPGQVAGTISDATSPVSGRVAGNRLILAYKLEGGLSVSQVLTLAPGGQSAHNAMKIRKMGMVVARLEETIRRQPK